MRPLSRLRFVWSLALLAGAVASASTHLQVGDAAPEFALPATTGEEVRLSGHQGERTVVLAFFPKAFTSGCTQEMKNYQADLTKFVESDAVIYGVSTDDVETNRKFAESLDLEFALLSDPDGEAAQKYGVYNEDRGFASRATFVIGRDGKIAHIEQGSAAVDVSGAARVCNRLKKK